MALLAAALAVLAKPAVSQESGFGDVSGGVHAPAIGALADAGVIEGTECAQNMFCPDEPFLRWTMAVWIVRSLGEQPSDTANGFSDVDSDVWWAPYVQRLAELGVTQGCATNPLRYCPNEPVTRAQMATFLVRAFDPQPAGGQPGFSDVSADHFHKNDINTLALSRITAGCATNKYCPNNNTTRAQMASFLARATGLIPLPEPQTTNTETAMPMNLALSGVCPSPLVVQTDWFPESEHGAMYELLGDDYSVDVDNKVVRGSMVLGGTDLGIEWEVRTGGPAIGFSPVSQHMAADGSIHLGYASTDQQVNHWDVAPLVSVVAPLERNPQMVMWDPETYPDVESIADLGDLGVTINVFGGGTFPDVFIAQGIWTNNQVDPSYDGSPARFIAEDGEIAQQGFATNEVYTYEHVHEEWGRPVAFQLLHDAGFPIYSQTISVRPDDLEKLRPCLERLVPIIQQAVVSFIASPDRANAIIVDAVQKYQGFWVYPSDLADFSVQAQIRYRLVGNGPDYTVGNMVGQRIAKVLNDIRAAGWDLNPDLTADQLFTNEFIDPTIGF